ncbi:hypothetical protein [Plantactinospora sp. KLBMP9567]|uniref:hypothetical protein n=1 Tax=Plantactinospora sp. KLBMP9567 TaxID=3085900 RepID=UPI0029820680|nr:hypothetical protein [Plantactinospora sp. KLBMP9567]MDW5326427.1 hypothetical protein [Plantactinospora sp. KLBMP9567]
MHLETKQPGWKAGAVRRIAAAVALAAVASLGVVVVSAAPAEAIPSNCSKIVRTRSNAAVCKSGSGYYRAWARCTNQSSKKATYRYGYWRSVGSIASNASCTSAEAIVSSSRDAGITTTDYLPPY